MTGNELYNQLISYGDLDVSDTVVKGWINTAQKEVSLDFPISVSVTVSPVVEGTTYPTTGIIRLVSAYSPDGEYPLTNMTITSSQIVFNVAATSVTVVYAKVADDYTSMPASLTIHPAFHPFILYYLLSMYYDMEGEGDEEESDIAQRFYNRWIFYKSNVLSTLKGSDVDVSPFDPVETQDVLPKSSRSAWVEDDNYE